MKKLFLMCILFLCSTSFSYIPQSYTIYKKMAENNGSGIYEIVQEVVFKNSNNKLLIQETWIVENGQKMYLQARGRDFYFEAIYLNDKKYFSDLNGQLSESSLSSDFFESIFHFRDSQNFAQYLASKDIIPSTAAKAPKKIYHLSNVEYKAEPFVNLSRTNGLIAYGFGKLNEAGSTQKHPRLWVEQDQFRILRFRLASNVEVLSENYAKYSAGFYFARNKTITWDENITPVRVLRVNRKTATKKLLENFQTAKLKASKQEAKVGESDLHKVALNFYKRFR